MGAVDRMDTADIPVQVWGCLMPVEQLIAGVFADTLSAGIPFLVASGVDIIFQAGYGIAWERYRDAWRGNWGIDAIALTVEGVEVSVYVDGIGWSERVADCRADGGCSTGSSDCTSIKRYGYPSG